MPLVGLLNQRNLLKGALLASLDIVPVFWRRRRPSQNKNKSSKKAASAQSSPQKRALSLLPFYAGIGALLLALHNNHDDADDWRLVAPMIVRRVASLIVPVTWPRLILGLAAPQQDNDGKAESQESSSDNDHKKDGDGTRKSSSNKGNSKTILQILVDGGPLGPGCDKLVNSLVGVLVCLAFDQSSPLLSYCHIVTMTRGESPSLWTTIAKNAWLPAVVAGLSLAVNAVLWAWSHLQHSRGNHDGVNRMVASTMGRSLTAGEKLRLLAWAFINAASEEVTARGLQRGEFHALLLSDSRNNQGIAHLSNSGQALVFGMAHYYGIPSGWTGVGLTIVYGLLMGLIADAGQGLSYPILAHTVADYFIVATIARRKVV